MTVLAEGQSDTKALKRRTTGQRIRRCIKRDLKKLFLKRYARSGNVSQACRDMLIARNTFYVWLKRDRLFASQYEELNEPLYQRSFTPEAAPLGLDVAVRSMSDRALMVMATRLNRRRWR